MVDGEGDGEEVDGGEGWCDDEVRVEWSDEEWSGVERQGELW